MNHPTDPEPTATPDNGEAPLRVARQRRIAAPPERIWRVLEEPDTRRDVLGGDLDVDLQPGSQGTFDGGDGVSVPAHVREVEEPRRLVFDWGEDERRSTVRIDLVPDGAHTLVEVVEEQAQAASIVAELRHPVVGGARDALCLAA